MQEFIYRTESIKNEEILDFFVETEDNRLIIDSLKERNPIILVGSRGVGKSFLFRVAEAELTNQFEEKRILPVYESFSKSSFVVSKDSERFQHWMLARLCSKILRTLKKFGFLSKISPSISILGGEDSLNLEEKTKIEKIAEEFENSWKNPTREINTDALPTTDELKDIIEDLCLDLNINRFVIFFDEAAHVFLPEQQRQFFTLYRDLRSPYITCNAAVYPGVTYYGESFQPEHDATMVSLDRDIKSPEYINYMKKMVEKQADSSIIRDIGKNEANFSLLAYASSGNPRILFKTLLSANKVNSAQVNKVIREYYRTNIWSEHSDLAEKYSGHKLLVDWGRRFIEEEVLPGLNEKNQKNMKSTCYFWIHRDSPQLVKEALRLLAYTGIVRQHSKGIKATRSEIGTRYMVNLGCLFALEATPTSTAIEIVKNLSVSRMSEYGLNHIFYQDLLNDVSNLTESLDMSEVLRQQMSKSIEVLDITEWQKERLKSININTIEEVLRAKEEKLKEARYVGDKRARRMYSAATTAIYEYLSG
ncbi:helix-hairpin-helix domain-containing protein [Methanosarcina sp.]|uniref:helix-hairpin-helix domain-containing protein n=1 Tax=Methanosarcina sp. TaxID=2213 RepID=UPI003C71DE53